MKKLCLFSLYIQNRVHEKEKFCFFSFCAHFISRQTTKWPLRLICYFKKKRKRKERMKKGNFILFVVVIFVFFYCSHTNWHTFSCFANILRATEQFQWVEWVKMVHIKMILSTLTLSHTNWKHPNTQKKNFVFRLLLWTVFILVIKMQFILLGAGKKREKQKETKFKFVYSPFISILKLKLWYQLELTQPSLSFLIRNEKINKFFSL